MHLQFERDDPFGLEGRQLRSIAAFNSRHKPRQTAIGGGAAPPSRRTSLRGVPLLHARPLEGRDLRNGSPANLLGAQKIWSRKGEKMGKFREWIGGDGHGVEEPPGRRGGVLRGVHPRAVLGDHWGNG